MRLLRVAFFIAYKSITRGNMAVTILAISILILANLNCLFVPSLLEGITQSANEKLVNTYSSNIIIEAKGNDPVIKMADELVEQIELIDGVTGVTYRNQIGAKLVYEDERTDCLVVGASPEHEKRVFEIADAIFEGSYLNPQELDKMLLGVQIAGSDLREIELYSSSLKKAHAGDKISVYFANGVNKQYEVKGVFHTELIRTDLQAFITDTEFSSVTGLGTDEATTIHVKITNDDEAPRIINEITQLRDNLRFQTWQDTAGIVRSMTDSFTTINNILSVVNLLVAGITIFIITYIDLVNKRRQIGISRAVGISPGAIVVSYIFRAVFFAILSIIASYLLYIYVAMPLEARYPFRFPFGFITLYLDNNILMRSALTIFCVAIAAAFLPAWRTIRMNLLDAIWG